MKRIVSHIMVAIALVSCGQQNQTESEVNSLEDEFDPEVYERSTTSSYMSDDLKLVSSKDPVLVYYAVDSEEPFMQTAVDYEVRALREICVKKNANVNWVIFLNSHYVHRSKKYLTCKAGVYRERTLTAEISRTVNTVSDPDFDPANPTDGVKIKLKHKKKYNKLFKKYPFAHPEVLAKVLEYTAKNLFASEDYTFFLHLKSHGSDELLLSGLTEEKLTKKLDRQKSVFSDYMDSVREVARTSDADIDLRNRVACEAKGALWKERACYCESSERYINQFYGDCRRSIGRAGLGTVGAGELGLEHMGLGRTPMLYSAAEAMGSPGMGSPGMGSPGMGSPGMGSPGMGSPGMGSPGMGSPGMGSPGMGSPGMGSPGMGSPGMGSPGMGSPGMGSPGMGSPGMGSPGMGFDDVGQAGGLGVAGMGADNYFGTSHEAMAEVLERLKSKRIKFGFIFFESCESNVKKNKTLRKALEAKDSGVYGYYSANGSLWYRNLDWQHILYWASKDDAKRSGLILKTLKDWTNEIPTWVEREDEGEDEDASR